MISVLVVAVPAFMVTYGWQQYLRVRSWIRLWADDKGWTVESIRGWPGWWWPQAPRLVGTYEVTARTNDGAPFTAKVKVRYARIPEIWQE